MNIELLLAHADDGRPTLEEGLSLDAAASAPAPAAPPGEDLRHDGGDPGSLREQRWGLVVPEGKIGDRLLALVEPLRRARKEQQGHEVVVFRARPGIGPEEASAWWNDVYHHPDVTEADRPRYLLLLGDADLVSWDLQQRLASDTFIGRLCFPAERGYEAYVHKLLASERRPPEASARALFCAVKDGSPATTLGETGLLAPTLSQTREGREKGTFGSVDIEQLGAGGPVSADDIVAAAAAGRPTLLFSISNGCGAPRDGWKSHKEQLRTQGAMVLGGGARLLPEDVAERPFLPEGAWFYFACFGAGTPQRSAYHHWLAALRDLGLYGGKADSVLRSLPGEGGRPFASALALSALANERGPLAVMSHVDLAWTFSFQDVSMPGRYRPSRFLDVFRTVLGGKRIGAGYHKLQRFFNQASVDLVEMYHQDARRRGRLSPDEERARATRRALLWMLRQDLSAYVLLGDPAARLRVGPAPGDDRPAGDSGAREDAKGTSLSAAPARSPVPEMPSAPADSPAPSPLDRVDPARMEAALFPALGEDTMNALAAHFGVPRADLDRWVEAFRRGGRAGAGRPG